MNTGNLLSSDLKNNILSINPSSVLKLPLIYKFIAGSKDLRLNESNQLVIKDNIQTINRNKISPLLGKLSNYKALKAKLNYITRFNINETQLNQPLLLRASKGKLFQMKEKYEFNDLLKDPLKNIAIEAKNLYKRLAVSSYSKEPIEDNHKGKIQSNYKQLFKDKTNILQESEKDNSKVNYKRVLKSIIQDYNRKLTPEDNKDTYQTLLNKSTDLIYQNGRAKHLLLERSIMPRKIIEFENQLLRNYRMKIESKIGTKRCHYSESKDGARLRMIRPQRCSEIDTYFDQILEPKYEEMRKENNSIVPSGSTIKQHRRIGSDNTGARKFKKKCIELRILKSKA